jgi:predicted DNA-binding protein
MSEDVKAAAERLIALGEFYERLLTHRRYSDDLLLVAPFALEAADRQAALAAELGRLKAAITEFTAAQKAIEELNDYHSEQYAVRAFLRRQTAMDDLAALDTATAVAPGAEAGVAETCPDCGHLDHAGRRCRAGCSIWHCSAGRRAVAPGASDAGE